jgi:hypothetical protein
VVWSGRNVCNSAAPILRERQRVRHGGGAGSSSSRPKRPCACDDCNACPRGSVWCLSTSRQVPQPRPPCDGSAAAAMSPRCRPVRTLLLHQAHVVTVTAASHTSLPLKIACTNHHNFQRLHAQKKGTPALYSRAARLETPSLAARPLSTSARGVKKPVVCVCVYQAGQQRLVAVCTLQSTTTAPPAPTRAAANDTATATARTRTECLVACALEHGHQGGIHPQQQQRVHPRRRGRRLLHQRGAAVNLLPGHHHHRQHREPALRAAGDSAPTTEQQPAHVRTRRARQRKHRHACVRGQHSFTLRAQLAVAYHPAAPHLDELWPRPVELHHIWDPESREPRAAQAEWRGETPSRLPRQARMQCTCTDTPWPPHTAAAAKPRRTAAVSC